jgi:hypothetical protein
VRFRIARQNALMSNVEYIPTRTADGTLVLRAVILGPLERLRRWLKA